MNPGSVLEVRGVTVRFGGLTALDAVSLAVPPRHVLGVIGPNGAGKTTLLNVLCGFIRPDAGEVLFGGRRHEVRPHRLAGLGVARTLQGVGLYGGLTALENVMVGATCRASAGFWSALISLPRASRDERKLRELAVAALDRVGAADAAQARPGELSYGMRKRVALARALVAKPGPDPARRARQRPGRERAGRARRPHPRPGRRGIARGGRASHGPDDVRLRLDRGPRLREGDRDGHAARGPGQSRRDRGLPRYRP